MPALTHGRVINGFNQYSRSITYARPNCPAKPKRDECGGQKPFCCGVPLQPFKIRPGTYCGSGFCRIPTGPCSRKQASATGVVGRSFAAKRAIGRRVANCHGHPNSCALTGTLNIQTSLKSAAQLQSKMSGSYLYDDLSPSTFRMHVIKNARVTSFVTKSGTSNSFASVEICLGDEYAGTISLPNNIESMRKVPSKMIEINIMSSAVYSQFYIGMPLGGTESIGLADAVRLRQSGGGHSCCCMLPTVTFTKPVNAYHMPARCAKGSIASLSQRIYNQSFKFPGRVGGRCCLQQPCKGS